MAKQKVVKLTDFFSGYRRKSYLVRYEHLKDRKEYGEFKLELRFPLLNEPVLGMNGIMSEAYGLMQKDDSQLGRTNLEVKLDGMTTEFFSTGDTEQSKIPTLSRTGVRLTKLALVPNREGEKREVNLELCMYISASEQLRDWAYLMIHKEFHLECVYSQSEMNFGSGELEDDDSDEDEDSEDGDDGPAQDAKAADDEIPEHTPPAAVVMPKRPKTGPKDLAAFHRGL